MKRILILVILAAVLICACDMEQAVRAGGEQLLRSIAENKEIQTWIAEHPIDTLASDAKDTLVRTFPVLEDLLDLDNAKQVIKSTGLDLLREYVASADPETQEKAQTLGAIIQILYPELTDEVNAVLEK